MSKTHFVWQILFNFTNTGYLFFLNVHKTRQKQRSSSKFKLSKYWLYDKLPVEHAILSFSVFSFFQHWHVFWQNDEFSKFSYVTNFYDLETFHVHLQKSQFYCLLFRNSRNIKYFISLISRIRANGYWSISNWGYIYYQVSKNRSLKILPCLFHIFILATLTLILLKTLWKKLFFGRKPFLRQFSEVILKLYHVTISKDLATLDSKMVAIIIAYCEDVIVFWVQP